MRSHWKPVIAVLLTAPFLTELLSGNLPFSAFFQPQNYLFLATVGYGFPIVLLREFAVRRHLGLAGLFLLGLAYGIFNEGILAKTFYLSANVPIGTFSGYGFTFGMEIPWAITISIWHALHSFIYPVVAISYFFPKDRETPWLTARAISCLAVPTAAIGAVVFLLPTKDHPAGNHGLLILMLALMGLLLWLAARLGARAALGGPHKLRSRAFFLGALAFFLLLLVPILLTFVKVPLWFFYGYNLLLVSLILYLICHRRCLAINEVLLFAVGDDAAMAAFGLATTIAAGDFQRIASNTSFLLLFGWVVLWLRKSAARDGEIT
jgi:hypothetical protein